MAETNKTQKQSQVPALKGVVDKTLGRIKELKQWNALHVPDDYSPENAVRSASFIISDLKDKDKKPVLESCSSESIANALLDMVVQGLSPMKKQCSFIPRGGKLFLQREYAGTLALAKRFGSVNFVNPVIIYNDDKFSYIIEPSTGRIIPKTHEQEIDNIDINKIKGAYAVVNFGDNQTYTEIMTISMIRRAWEQGEMKGKSKAHTNFTDQMVKKTVINRACKLFINSSSDAPIVPEEEPIDYQKDSVDQEISEGANKKAFDTHSAIEDAKEVNEEKDSGENNETASSEEEPSRNTEKSEEATKEANQKMSEMTNEPQADF